MGPLIAAVRRAESAAVVVATSKWAAMIGVVSECQSIKLELLAKQRMHRPNSTSWLEQSTNGQTHAVVPVKKEKKKKKLAKGWQSSTDFSHVLKRLRGPWSRTTRRSSRSLAGPLLSFNYIPAESQKLRFLIFFQLAPGFGEYRLTLACFKKMK